MSMFTARNYSWLASIMRDRLCAEGDSFAILELAEWLAQCLESENPAFNRARFYHNIWCDPTNHAHGPNCPYSAHASRTQELESTL